MRAYSTREVAGLVGDTQQRVRAAARAGIVSPAKTARGHLRFSFQDLVFLRSAKALERQSIDVRRTWRALRAVRAFLPAGRPLSSVRVIAAHRRVFVRENNTSWDPQSGQTLFDFATLETTTPADAVAQSGSVASITSTHTTEYWFARGLRLDRGGAVSEAIDAYRKVIELDTSHVDARINLGRLFHNAGRYAEAEQQYREALDAQPSHPIAAFNLGVVLEDQGALDAAIDHYVLALDLDPSLPDAHYNLARLYGWRGDRELAARHLARFRTLNDDES